MLAFIFHNNGIGAFRKREANGFTLIEMIAVIVILSIVATIGTGFVVRTTEAYQRTQTRALLFNTSRQALERMTRQLRISLPYSVRLTNNGTCIEFMPIAAGGNYFDPVPDQQNLAPATANIPASPVPNPVDFGTAVHVSIGAMSDAEIYGVGAPSRALYLNGNIVLAAPMQWRRNSINRRYYLLNNPQAFCVVGTNLRFYQGLNVDDANVNTAATSDLIARNVSGNNPFSLATGSENRNTAINITLSFSSGGETIAYNQRVLIRNVP